MLEAKQGPQSFADKHSTKIDYCGVKREIYKFFNRTVFEEEVRKLAGDVRLSVVSERVFVLALQSTTNRMSN